MDSSGKIIMGATLAVIAWTLYKAYVSQPSNKKQQKGQCSENHKYQLLNPRVFGETVKQKMKKCRLSQNPSIDQCKEALLLTFEYTLNNLRLFNLQMKRKINLERNSNQINFEYYLKLLIQGLQQSKLISNQSRKTAYQLMNIENETIRKYASQLSGYTQTLKTEGITNLPGIKYFSRRQAQKIISTLTQYYRQNGQNLCDLISNSVVLWTQKRKQLLLKVLSLIVIDLALADSYPEVDQMQIQYAKKKYKEELASQLADLAREQTKFYTKLTQQIFQKY